MTEINSHETLGSIEPPFIPQCMRVFFLGPCVIYLIPIALTGSFTDRHKIHATLVIANYAVYITFIALFAIQLGEFGNQIAEL
jgi:hypothetical protein